MTRLVLLLGMIAAIVGCDGGGSNPEPIDFGNNNPALYIAVGDSITEGYNNDGYAPALAALLKVPVENRGVGGTVSREGISSASSALRSNPGWLLVLYGANDAIHGYDVNKTIDNLRTIARMCFAHKTIPVMATPPPMFGRHGRFDGNVEDIAIQMRVMAAEEGVRLVDLYQVMQGREDLFQDDGLHPTDEGNSVIAQKFFKKL